jgi:ATPase subunit of ABC transporter with duplicated ATPase domains
MLQISQKRETLRQKGVIADTMMQKKYLKKCMTFWRSFSQSNKVVTIKAKRIALNRKVREKKEAFLVWTIVAENALNKVRKMKRAMSLLFGIRKKRLAFHRWVEEASELLFLDEQAKKNKVYFD